MSKLKIVLVLLVLALSLFLRYHNYRVYPQRGATSDEYTYAFLGVSLLTKGVPISWSFFGAYPTRTNLTIDHIYFPIVQPYFDNPPLNGLLTGAWALLFGENTFQKITLPVIRILPIVLSLISSLLLFGLAKKLYGYKVALWSLLIFSTTTIFVMNARVVVAENLLTVLTLASIYTVVTFLEKRNTKYLLLLGLFSGLSMLTKIDGVAIFFAALYLLFLHNAKIDQILKFVGVFLLSPLALLLFAAHYDWNLFWAVQKSQSDRPIGPFTFFRLLGQPTIVNAVYQDGWYYAGFFSLLTSFLNMKKHQIINTFTFFYIFILLATLSSDGLSGWYLLPLFPLMSITIASLFEQGIKEISWIVFAFLMFVGMYEINMLLHLPFGLDMPVYRILLTLFFIPLLGLYVLKNKKWFEILSEAWFYLLILGNIFITYHYVHPA